MLSFSVIRRSQLLVVFRNRTRESCEMANVTFEKFLFKKFKAVFVDGMSESATSNINLLDILIRTDTEGYPPFRRPVLTKVGSLLELGTDFSQESVSKLREGLTRFEDDRGDDLFDWRGDFQDINKTFSAAKSLTGSVIAGPFAEAAVDFSRAKSLDIKLENLETACVDKDYLVDLVARDELWKPDISNRRLRWSDLRKSGYKLWVIHQILYASRLEVSCASSKSAGARAVTAVPATPGAGFQVSHDRGPNNLVLSVGKKSKFPGKFVFAYRAVRFEFDSTGKLVEHVENVGNHMPVHRGDEEGPYDDEREQIEDLFSEKPSNVISDSDDEDEDEWDGQPLPIQEIAD